MSQAISQANVHANPQANMQASSQAHQLIVERREWADRHYYTVRDDSSAEGVVVYPFPIDEVGVNPPETRHELNKFLDGVRTLGHVALSDSRPRTRRQVVYVGSETHIAATEGTGCWLRHWHLLLRGCQVKSKP